MGDTKAAKAAPKVLRVMRECRSGQHHYAFDLMQATMLDAISVYGALARLEDERWITSGWEEPTRPDGPRRRYYMLAADKLLDHD